MAIIDVPSITGSLGEVGRSNPVKDVLESETLSGGREAGKS